MFRTDDFVIYISWKPTHIAWFQEFVSLHKKIIIMFIFDSHISYRAILQSSLPVVILASGKSVVLYSPFMHICSLLHTPIWAGPTYWFHWHWRWGAEGEFSYHSGSKANTSNPGKLEKNICRLQCFILSQSFESMSTIGSGWLHPGMDTRSCAMLAHALRNAWLLSSELTVLNRNPNNLRPL